MFGSGSSNIRGAGIGSGSIGMFLACDFSGVDSSRSLSQTGEVAFLVYVRLSKHEMLGGNSVVVSASNSNLPIGVSLELSSVNKVALLRLRSFVIFCPRGISD